MTRSGWAIAHGFAVCSQFKAKPVFLPLKLLVPSLTANAIFDEWKVRVTPVGSTQGPRLPSRPAAPAALPHVAGGRGAAHILRIASALMAQRAARDRTCRTTFAGALDARLRACL